MCIAVLGVAVVHPLPASGAVWNSISPAGPTPSARQEYTLVRDTEGQRLILFGGYDGTYMNDVWELSVSSPLPSSWVQLTPDGTPPVARASHSAVYDPAHRGMWVFGGSDGISYRNDVHFLDLTVSPPHWYAVTTQNAPPSPRRSNSATYDPERNRVVLIGGFPYNNEVWALNLPAPPPVGSPGGGDPGVASWEHLVVGTLFGSPALSPRQGHSATYDPFRQRIVVFGGDNGPSYLNDVLALDMGQGTTSNWLAEGVTGTPPSPRRFVASDYDPVTQQIILFGGQGDAGLMSDVWSMSRSGVPVWSEITPALPPGPGARFVQTGVFDDDRFLVFGGSDPLGVRNDLWALSSIGCGAYTISASAGSGGSIAPAGAVVVACGGSQSFTITPDACQVIESVLIDGVPEIGIPASGPWTRTFSNVTAAHTIQVTFGAANASAPPRLQAWWTFDETTALGRQTDLAHYTSGVNGGTLTGSASVIPAGMVGQALRCSGTGSGMMLAPAPGSIVVGNCSFGIDAWIKLDPGTPAPGSRRTIAAVENLPFYVDENGRLGIGVIGSTFNPPISAGVWHHVAVTVRGGCASKPKSTAFFVDGVRVQVVPNAVVSGTGALPTSVTVGCAANGADVLEGEIDEVDVFRPSQVGTTDLAVIGKIFAAGCAGKMREFVRLPLYARVPKNGSPTPVCALFTNLTGSNQTYNWIIPNAACVGLVASPAQSSSPELVPAGSTVLVPLSFTRTLAGSCRWRLLSTNTASLRGYTAEGAFPKSVNKLWPKVTAGTPQCEVAGSPQSGPAFARVPGDEPALTHGTTQFVVQNDSNVALPFAYRIEALDPESLELSEDIALDGLPAGVPKTGSVNVPAGGSAAINVIVHAGTNSPFRTDQLVLYADLDGDAILEPQVAALIAAVEDTTGDLVSVPPGRGPRAGLSAAPNPFRGKVTTQFTVPLASQVDVRVFDVAGRLVRVLASGRLEAGVHSIEWDGKDSSDRSAGAGMYFVRAEIAGAQQQTRVVQLR